MTLMGAGFSQQNLPTLSGRIVDNADIFDVTTRQQLESKLTQLEQQSGDQIAILTIASLNGEAIESFSNRLFRQWALGESQINNGVLLVIAPNDRQVRIEVGYGLEGTLTDALSSLVINGIMLPQFRDGHYGAGTIEAVDALISIIQGDQAGFQERIKQKQQQETRKQQKELLVQDIIGILFFIFFVTITVAPQLARIFGTKIAPGRYKWLGIIFTPGSGGGGGRSGRGGGFGSGGFGGSGGGFRGGGGSSGGGGASGRW